MFTLKKMTPKKFKDMFYSSLVSFNILFSEKLISDGHTNAYDLIFAIRTQMNLHKVYAKWRLQDFKRGINKWNKFYTSAVIDFVYKLEIPNMYCQMMKWAQSFLSINFALPFF